MDTIPPHPKAGMSRADLLRERVAYHQRQIDAGRGGTSRRFFVKKAERALRRELARAEPEKFDSNRTFNTTRGPDMRRSAILHEDHQQRQLAAGTAPLVVARSFVAGDRRWKPGEIIPPETFQGWRNGQALIGAGVLKYQTSKPQRRAAPPPAPPVVKIPIVDPMQELRDALEPDAATGRPHAECVDLLIGDPKRWPLYQVALASFASKHDHKVDDFLPALWALKPSKQTEVTS